MGHNIPSSVHELLCNCFHKSKGLERVTFSTPECQDAMQLTVKRQAAKALLGEKFFYSESASDVIAFELEHCCAPQFMPFVNSDITCNQRELSINCQSILVSRLQPQSHPRLLRLFLPFTPKATQFKACSEP